MLRKVLFALVSVFFFWNLFTFYNVLSVRESSVENETKANKKLNLKTGDFPVIPLAFVKNSGELDGKVKYYEKSAGHSTLFTKKGIFIELNKRGSDNSPGVRTIKITPVKGNRDVRINSSGIQKATLNYLVGNDPSRWRKGVQIREKVIYREMYEGIDVKFYGNNNQLEYDFVINPGADTSSVRLKYEGIRKLQKDEEGNLEILLYGGDRVVQSKPHIYQIINDEYINIEGNFKIFGDNISQGFEVASYNKDYPLIIDPVLSYSSYLGGNNDETGNSLTVDGSGNLYIVGKTASSNFPVMSALQGTLKETAYDPQTITADAFITKVDSTGNSLVFSTFFGGNNDDSGDDIAIDGAGNIYITGKTFSSDLPVSTTIQTSLGGSAGASDAFVAKLNSSASAVEYLTYLGGSSDDYAKGIAIDSSGNAYVAGVTASSDFPVTSSLQGTSGGGDSDAFVSKINSAGTSLSYSTYLGGADIDEANDIAVDSSGYALVTGETLSSDFPLATAEWNTKSSLSDAFISKIAPSGSTLFQSTYFGGNDEDWGSGIAVDANDSFYVVGTTYSDDLPVLTDAIQANLAAPLDGTSDIFVAKFTNSISFSTYLGGDKDDSGNGIAVDSQGNIYIVGDTNSTNFPTTIPLQKSKTGQFDTVVAKINASGQSVNYSTYYGGSKDDIGLGITVDGNGNAYITGYTETDADFPLSTSLQTTLSGTRDAFLAKLDPNVTGTIEVRTNLDEATFTIAGPQNFSGSGKLWTTQALAGVYTITMDAVTGYKTPPSKAKSVDVGETTIFSKTYVSTTGVITVTTNLDNAAFTLSGPATYSGSGKLWSQTGAPEGDYTITFTAVADYKTPDSQTDALAGGGVVTFDATYLPESAPDFKYKSVKTPRSAKRGKKIKVTASVKNIGNQDASSSTSVIFYFSKKKAKSIDEKAILIGKKNVTALASGKSKKVTLKKKIKKKTKKGKYYVKAFWDGKSAILESNESNNIGVSKKKLKLK